MKQSIGLLIIRVGVGLAMVIHGRPKMFNPESWGRIGKAMANFGIEVLPSFWGFMAAFAEFGGGILLALGLFSRSASSLLCFTMITAFVMHFNKGDSFHVYSHSLELGVVFLGLILIGPGNYSVDHLLKK